jgi:hypothetical protein
MRQPRQAVDEQDARRRRRRRRTRRVPRDHDWFGQRSIRVEMEGMADIHVPAGYCVHPRTGAPQLAAITEGIAGRETLGRRARCGVRVRRRTVRGCLRRANGQPHSCGTQATRHEGSGRNRGDKRSTHRVSFRKTPLRWRCLLRSSSKIAGHYRSPTPWARCLGTFLEPVPKRLAPSDAMPPPCQKSTINRLPANNATPAPRSSLGQRCLEGPADA